MASPSRRFARQLCRRALRAFVFRSPAASHSTTFGISSARWILPLNSYIVRLPLSPMPSRFFITGTDTGIGKTTVSALLCAALDAIYWKPIQTGTRDGADRSTILRLAGLSGAQTVPETYRFAPPVSPHLAARRAGV